MNHFENGEMPEFYLNKLSVSRKAYSGLGIAVAVLFVVYLVASYALMFAVAYLIPQIYEQWWFEWVMSILPLYGFALPAFYLCLRRVEKGKHDTDYVSAGFIYEKPTFHAGHWALFAVVCFGLMYIGSLVGNGLMTLLSNLVGYDYQNGLNDLADNRPWWMILLGTVIIAPIGEERAVMATAWPSCCPRCCSRCSTAISSSSFMPSSWVLSWRMPTP